MAPANMKMIRIRTDGEKYSDNLENEIFSLWHKEINKSKFYKNENFKQAYKSLVYDPQGIWGMRNDDFEPDYEGEIKKYPYGWY